MRHLVVIVAAVVMLAAACTAEPVSTTSPDATVTTAESTTPSTDAGPATSTTGADQTTSTTMSLADTELKLVTVADGFEQPVFFTVNRGRNFVVDQPGVIWEFTAAGQRSIFLDLRDRVRFGGEQGLLGLAFHPEHEGVLYVDYTGRDGRTVVSEFTIPEGSQSADPASERIVVEIAQPAGNHNGGMIAFGPMGELWIGMGDGGAADDKFGNGQRDDTLLGAMLRIVVGPGIETYEPSGNHVFSAPEIWAIGLRNPWRFSFDGASLWIADVGQGDIEEVNRISVDDVEVNFGWPLYEGSACFAGPCTGVDDAGRSLTGPVYEYSHDEGCSITGGYVYRGSATPQLEGHYFFSDWCTGFIRSIAPGGSVHDWTDQTGTVPSVTSFGRDEFGNLYVVSGAGTIYRIAEADT